MLKGKTKIELKDVRTGNVDVVEKDNMVTNALQYIFNPLGYIKSSDPMLTEKYVNFYKTLTGGLLLLNKPLTANVDNLYLPRNVEQTGCAVFDKQNSSNQTIRGSYNATETEIDVVNRKIKYVYDFDTAEANGTIAAVALTHAYGGYGNRGTDTDPVKGLYPFFINIGSGLLKYTGGSSGINAYDRTTAYTTYGNGYRWIIKIDAENDSVYYFTIMSTNSVKISRYRANINTISMFENPGASRTLLDEQTVSLSTAINVQYFSYNYEEETDRLYIVTASSNYVSNNGSYIITEVDLANENAVKQYVMTNKTGVSARIGYNRYDTYCYEGYIYFKNSSLSDHHYYRQQIGNSANVKQLPESAALRAVYPMLARDGKLYLENPSGYSGTYALYVVDTDSFTMKYPESYGLYDSSYRQYVPVRGVPMTYYLTGGSGNGTFAMRTDYLATINNLDSPVVKTADKTMKVTYTLSEEE